MSDYNTSKNALIASLCELSQSAAIVAKTAVNFCNVVGVSEDMTSVVKAASDSSKAAAKAVDAAHAAINGSSKSKKRVKSEADGVSSAGALALSGGSGDSKAEDSKPKKRAKIQRDPDAPKKPLTSYILFCNHLRASIAASNPTFSQTDIAKEVASQWKVLSDTDRAYWKGLYDTAKAKYDIDFAKYSASKKIEDAQKATDDAEALAVAAAMNAVVQSEEDGSDSDSDDSDSDSDSDDSSESSESSEEEIVIPEPVVPAKKSKKSKKDKKSKHH